ncbi:hypothetical protein [Microbacterium sp.]|uniref:hypothetical protein n=1 Tax=Microbacterium sp. TaxID=51671 RepID=UPI0028A8D81B|nr:hypothetical protein [Microbacterium sp.]
MGSKYPLGADSDELALEEGMRRVEVRTQSTPELIDLASLRNDFRLALVFLDSYLGSAIESDGPPPTAIDALWMSAVYMYGRAFSNGQRHAGRANTDHLGPGAAEMHEYFLGVRNKYLAHAVNGFEKGTVFADLYDPARAAGIARVGELHTSLVRLSREAAEALRQLCRTQVEALTRRIDILHRAVADELVELGASATYALADFVPPTLDGANPLSRRT